MSLQVKRENVPEKKVVLKTGEGEGSMVIRQATETRAVFSSRYDRRAIIPGRTCTLRSKSITCSKAKSGFS